jgi:hypothetical protein
MTEAFLDEAKHFNLSHHDHVGPYHSMHTEPNEEEIEFGYEQACKIRDMLLTDDFVESFCSQVFSYRINTSASLIQNLYEFFLIVLYRKMQLYFSPQFGFTLWVFQLGFQRYPPIEKILKEKTYIYFQDYIFENSTFIRYHYEHRYDSLFDFNFRKQFLKKVINRLVAFSDRMGRKYLFSSCLECALNMIEIKIYA